MKRSAIYFSFLFATIILGSCESSYIRFEDEGFLLKDSTSNQDNTVHFGIEIRPILQNKCSSCHFSGSDLDLESENIYSTLVNENLLNLTSPENSTLFTLPNPGHADDYLNPTEHLLIVKWIEQGALEN